MSEFYIKHQKVLKTIHRVYCHSRPDLREKIEDTLFQTGQKFMDFGTITLSKVGVLLEAKLIFIKFVEINNQQYEIVELLPAFQSACDEYVRPPGTPVRRNDKDDYEQPFRLDGIDTETDIPVSYISDQIYLMSARKLEQEIQKQKSKWLIYRTPYRPHRAITETILMTMASLPDFDPADGIADLLEGRHP